jgi:hypothetical protein
VRPSGASSLAAARSSPRVVPWFTITTGTPSDEACRTYRSPDITVNDEPSTTTAAEEDTREKHSSTRGLGTFSPKNTTSGLRTPPHERQSTTVNPPVSSSATSPSGFTAGSSPTAAAVQAGLAARSRSSSTSREDRSQHERHTTRCSEPCSSVTPRAPAAWCSPSTFCVMTPETSPARSSAATARCPALGAAPVMCRQPRCDRAQYRCRAPADPVNDW